ncbi:phospholipase D-like domain-containing protein [Nitrococcus mobilis]|uniref:Phospholipase D/Transphosphatidylase n=1 Tax=Nitrococcus mobilis Nb-231 TaxID=314278 RepID=A4BUU1_9GAMM|nr:phospholipase D-like domain-containing protein [Nitrococcus mobilis]EAR20545.1 Phospholipase D/Transphosphatidylase [Nitrococcus mobilis Nb-231]
MEIVYWIGAFVNGLFATGTALHALLNKHEPTAAFGWIAVCLLFPILGPLLYFLLGINRIHMRARALRAEPKPRHNGAAKLERSNRVPPEFSQQARISLAVTGLPLMPDNRVETLHNGESAYPAMLDAIEHAQRTVFLSTYIFESNRTGRKFADTLARAVARGVDVRVLLDGAGEWYSLPRIRSILHRCGVRVAVFLPPRLLPPRLLLNLRNHRKILAVDGDTAFIGGMNIGDRHLIHRYDGRRGITDMHFRIEGPVARQIESVFLSDWLFTTGDSRLPEHPPPAAAGNAFCRTIIDGPHESLNRLAMVLVGAIAAARHRIAIMTPYFLPPRELISALQAAAIRGIRVDIVLPEQNNLPFMHWATRNMLWQLIDWGVHVYYRPPPFSHTKLFVVDSHYAQIGSANLDPRSLYLNFELVAEVYDPGVGGGLAYHVDQVRLGSREVTLRELDERPFPARVRDAFCWLFTPHL